MVSTEIKTKLKKTVHNIIGNNKGIIYNNTLNNISSKISEKYNIKKTHENKYKYIEIICESKTIKKMIGGIVVNKKTFCMKNPIKKNYYQNLKKAGIELGCKIDKGKIILSNDIKNKSFNEIIDQTMNSVNNINKNLLTIGIDDLENRLKKEKYKNISFVIWKAFFYISKGSPSDNCIDLNVNNLCKFAKIAQDMSIVPILDIKINNKGNYSYKEMLKISKIIYNRLIFELNRQEIYLPGLILKMCAINNGKKFHKKLNKKKIVKKTLELIKTTIPLAVGGIVFSSLGKLKKYVYKCLKATTNEKIPYNISYSLSNYFKIIFFKAWKGKNENITSAIDLLEKKISRYN